MCFLSKKIVAFVLVLHYLKFKHELPAQWNFHLAHCLQQMAHCFTVHRDGQRIGIISNLIPASLSHKPVHTFIFTEKGFAIHSSRQYIIMLICLIGWHMWQVKASHQTHQQPVLWQLKLMNRVLNLTKKKKCNRGMFIDDMQQKYYAFKQTPFQI